MRLISLRCVLVVLFYAAMVHAGHAQTFHKCLGAQGRPEFSGKPCETGVRQEKVQPRDNTLKASGLREQHLIQENQRLRRELDNDRSSRQQIPSAGRTPSDLQAERVDTIACQRARRDLDIAAHSISSNRDAVQARRSAMYGACGMKEPPRFTIINNPAPYLFRHP